MAKKKTTITAVFEVEHDGGPKTGDYEYLAEHLADEWDGLNVYFQDPQQDDETSVNLTVRSITASE